MYYHWMKIFLNHQSRLFMKNSIIYTVLFFLGLNSLAAQNYAPTTSMIRTKGDIIPAAFFSSKGLIGQVRYNQDEVSTETGYLDMAGVVNYNFSNMNLGLVFVRTNNPSFSINTAKLNYTYKISFDNRSIHDLNLSLTPSFKFLGSIDEYILKDQEDEAFNEISANTGFFNLGISAYYRRNMSGIGSYHRKALLSIGLSAENVRPDNITLYKDSDPIEYPNHLYNSLELKFSMSRVYGIKASILNAYNLDNKFNSSLFTEVNFYRSNINIGLGYNTAKKLLFSGSIGFNSPYSEQSFEIGTLVSYNMASVLYQFSPLSFGVNLIYRGAKD